MRTRRVKGSKFAFGTADTGRLVLTREDGSVAVCGVVLMRRDVSFVDNEDSTFDLVFESEGS